MLQYVFVSPPRHQFVKFGYVWFIGYAWFIYYVWFIWTCSYTMSPVYKEGAICKESQPGCQGFDLGVWQGWVLQQKV
jgi:hypothetical protein